MFHSYICIIIYYILLQLWQCFVFAATNGNLLLRNYSGGEELFKCDFETILSFVTGATRPPPSGFQNQPTIQFHDEGPYPRTNTCANTLYLSVQQPLPRSEEYIYRLAFGILNSAGFGRV